MIPNNQIIGLAVSIDDVDVTGFVTSVEWGQGDVSSVGTHNMGVDAVVGTASIQLVDDPDLAPLFHDYAVVRVTVDRVTWTGYLGDGFSVRGRVVTVTARDPAKLLQDTIVDGITEYGSDEGTPLEAVVQAVMTQDLGENAPSLYCPVSPNALVGRFKPINESVWNTVQGLATRIGWFLGYMVVDGELRLSLIAPPRDSAAPHSLSITWDDMLDETFNTSTTDVRNSVTVEYLDAESGLLERVNAVDLWSIENVTGGVPKHSVISFDNNTGIDTFEEAERMATAFLDDLARVIANVNYELPLSPDVGIFTRLTALNPARSGDPQTFSVNSVRHRIAMTRTGFQGVTTVLASGQVIGGRRRWLNLEPRPGSPGDTDEHIVQLRAPVITAEPAPNGIVVNSDGLKGLGAVGMEIHASFEPGFTPDAGTLIHRGTDTRWLISGTPGNPMYALARELDSRDGVGPWSNEASATPVQAGLTPDEGALLDIVAVKHEAWTLAQETLDDQQQFWDAAAASLDGTMVTGEVTTASALSVTDANQDFESLGIQPGDQIRVHGPDDTFQIRAVVGVAGGLLTVAEPFDPIPAVGATFDVGRVDRITARTITDTDEEYRQEFGLIDDRLQNPDGTTSYYASVRNTAQEARTSLARQESDFVQSGNVDSAGTLTLTDANGDFDNPNGVVVGDLVYIMDGVAAGVTRSIASRTGTQLTLTEAWPSGKTPEPGDSYIVGRPTRVVSAAQSLTADRFLQVFTDVAGVELDVEALEGYFEPVPLEWADGTPKLWADGTQAYSASLKGSDVLGVNAALSLIHQTAYDITFLVTEGEMESYVSLELGSYTFSGVQMQLTNESSFVGIVPVSDTTQQFSRIEARNAAGQMMAAFGYIGNLPDSPYSHGLYTDLEAGAYIRGAPRFIGAGSGSYGNVPTNVYAPAGGFTIPNGKQWVLQVWPVNPPIIPRGDDVTVTAMRVDMMALDSSNNPSPSFFAPAGTWQRIVVTADYRWSVGGIEVLGPATLFWQIIEVDA